MDIADVGPAKQPYMNQQRIEVVEVATDFEKIGGEITMFPVSIKEIRTEGVKQCRKRQLDFWIAIIDGRIDEPAHPTVGGQNIPAPQITMKKCRRA